MGNRYLFVENIKLSDVACMLSYIYLDSIYTPIYIYIYIFVCVSKRVYVCDVCVVSVIKPILNWVSIHNNTDGF